MHMGDGRTISGEGSVESGMGDWAASRLNEDGGHMTSTGVLRLNAPTTSGERAECGKGKE